MLSLYLSEGPRKLCATISGFSVGGGARPSFFLDIFTMRKQLAATRGKFTLAQYHYQARNMFQENGDRLASSPNLMVLNKARRRHFFDVAQCETEYQNIAFSEPNTTPTLFPSFITAFV